MSSRIDDFLEKLAKQTPKASNASSDYNKTRSIEKIYLNVPTNFGRYQIFPMDSLVQDYPFVQLFDTKEISIPRKNISNDGVETVYNSWIKILPPNAYVMRDMTGRLVSSLTASDQEILNEARLMHEQLWNELDPQNNRDKKDITSLIRKRNYTIFFGYCLNFWVQGEARTPNRQNFSALFVCTAKSFTTAISEDIEEKRVINGGDVNFISSVYGRQLTNRDGFLMFSIGPNKLQAGYSVSVSHEYNRAKSLEMYSIPEEDAELMEDPVETFLGFQSGSRGNLDNADQVPHKRLFNQKLMKEATSFMAQQLSAIRAAKAAGTSIEDAIKITTQDALNNQTPTTPGGRVTNDPVLAQMAEQNAAANGGAQVVNPNAIINNNNNPFQSAPAAHIDPITSSPVMPNGGGQQRQSSAPFNPGFGGNSGFSGFANNNTAASPNDDLPF